MNDQLLSGQQLQQIQRQMAQAVASALEKMELRKVAMQSALEFVKTETSSDKSTDVVQLAIRIYDFLIQPAVDININITAAPQ